jgi:hypothetical protein
MAICCWPGLSVGLWLANDDMNGACCWVSLVVGQGAEVVDGQPQRCVLLSLVADADMIFLART